MIKTKRAFSLAEVLTTIAVIGVIATLVLPSLMQVKPAENKLMYKKAHAVLEQTVQTMINDQDLYPADSNYLAAPANGTNNCSNFANIVNTVGTVSCSSDSTGTPSFKTGDGVVWYVTRTVAGTTDDTGMQIVVDVNGDKGPNCGAAISSSYSNGCEGNPKQDRFMFGVRADGKVRVYDAFGQYILLHPTNNLR